MLTAQNSYANFLNKVTLISSSTGKVAVKFLNAIINLLSFYQNTNVIVLNALTDIELNINEKVKNYNSNFKKILPVISANIDKTSKEKSDNNYIVFILGYSKLYKHMKKAKEEDSTVESIDDLIDKLKNNDAFKFVIYDTASLLQGTQDSKVFNYLDGETGIWIGNGYAAQNIIDSNSKYSEKVKPSNDVGTLVIAGKEEYIRYIKG